MQNSIFTEVRKIIADKIGDGETIIVETLAKEIIALKNGIEGDDADFYIACAYSHVKDVVKRCVAKYDTQPKTDEQLTLDGFEHLQVAYSVNRNARVVLVPVDQLTDIELLDRAKEYDLMAKSCKAHAQEIREYVLSRQSVAA